MVNRPAMHRKVIDIKPDTFRSLSVIAASRGTNLKHLKSVQQGTAVHVAAFFNYKTLAVYINFCTFAKYKFAKAK